MKFKINLQSLRFTHDRSCFWVTGFALSLISGFGLAQQPLKLHPENPHYFIYNNRPIILITAGEHYGALINLDFDYIKYLTSLHEQGMNNTRIFTGSYVEREEDIDWMKYENTLAPRPNRLLVPWSRSNQAGYANGGNKFDLDSWDAAYFERLKSIITEAGKLGIMIELTFFGNQYKDGIWANSPLHPNNNIQGNGPRGKNSFRAFQTLQDEDLVRRQEAMMTKIIRETNPYDNLYFEVSNEPNNDSTDAALVNKWHAHMVKHIKKIEAELPKKHLIATNESIIDDPNVSVANYHYVKILTMPDFDELLALNKVISMDETHGTLFHNDADDARVEAWDFILRGGGAYNNLSWEHTPSNEAGTPGAEAIRKYLKNLQDFMSGFDFIKLKRANDLLGEIPENTFVNVLAEPAKQYAVYLHHSTIKGKTWIVSYDALIKEFTDTIVLDLPKGNYVQKWVNPSTGKLLVSSNTFGHPGGKKIFRTPPFTTDIALQLMNNTK